MSSSENDSPPAKADVRVPPKQEPPEPSSITESELRSSCRTGDLLLMHSRSWVYSIVEYFAGNAYNNVLMIVKDGSELNNRLSGVCVVEPYIQSKPGMKGGRATSFGYRISSLSDALDRYRRSGHDVAYRAMGAPREMDLMKIMPSGKDRLLCTSPHTWLRSNLGIDLGAEANVEKAWPGAFIAYLYVKLEYLSHDLAWTHISPSKFGADRDGAVDFSDSPMEPEREVFVA